MLFKEGGVVAEIISSSGVMHECGFYRVVRSISTTSHSNPNEMSKRSPKKKRNVIVGEGDVKKDGLGESERRLRDLLTLMYTLHRMTFLSRQRLIPSHTPYRTCRRRSLDFDPSQSFLQSPQFLWCQIPSRPYSS